MKPNDTFSYLKNNLISPDTTSLTQLYQPIIGSDARAVYDYLVAFFDNGRAAHPFTELLNHVQFGFGRCQAALDMLGAIGLIGLYQTDSGLLLKLNSPLDREAFLANGVLRSLLAQRIGSFSTEELMFSLPNDKIEVTKRFSDVFTDKGELYFRPREFAVDFKIDHFKDRMMKEGQFGFADERFDVVGLYTLSDTYKKSWYDLYQLAKETAMTVVDEHGLRRTVLSIERLRVKLDSLKNKPEVVSGQAEQALIKSAKSYKPLEFLEKYKSGKNAFVTEEEKKFIVLLSQRGLLDEVINILMFYTLQRTKTGSVNREYLLKVVNDFLFKNIKTAEQAVAHFTGETSRTIGEKPATNTNVPSWSKPDYKEDVTAEEQLELERQMNELLAQLDGED